MSNSLDSEKFSDAYSRTWTPVRQGEEPETEFFDHFFQRVAAHPIEWIVRLGWAEAEPKIVDLMNLKKSFLDAQREAVEALFNEIPKLSGKSRSEALTLKRKINDFQGKGKVPEPTSLLVSESSPSAAEALRRWRELAISLGAAQTAFAASYERHLSEMRAELLRLLDQPQLLDSVMLSSYSLYEALRRHVSDPVDSKGPVSKSQRQFERGFYKFLARACTKSNPLGLLAGVAPLEWTGSEPAVRATKGDEGALPGPIRKKRVLLKLPIVRELARLISAEPAIARQVVPRQNPTLHRKDNAWVFLVPPDTQNRALLALPENPVLDAMIETASGRALSAEKLVTKVHGIFAETHSRSEIEGYYASLCDKGVLIGHLEVPAECEDGLAFLRGWLERASTSDDGSVSRWASIVTRLHETLGALARAATHAETRQYLLEAKALLKGALPSARDENPLVVDCVVGVASKLVNRKVLQDVGDAIRLESIFFRLVTQGTPRAPATLENAIVQLEIPGAEWEGDSLPFSKLLPIGLKDLQWTPEKSRRQRQSLFPKRDEFRERIQAWLNRLRLPDGTLPRTVDLEKDGSAEFLADLQLARSRLGPGGGALQFSICAKDMSAIDRGEYRIVVEPIDAWGLALAARYLTLLEDQALEHEYSGAFDWLARHAHEGKLPVELLCYTGREIDTWTKAPSMFRHCVELGGARSDRSQGLIIPMDELRVKRMPSGGCQLVWRSTEGEKAVQPFCFALVNDAYIHNSARILIPLGERRGDNLNFHLFQNRKSGFQRDGHSPRITFGKLVLQRETWTFQAWDETLDALAGGAPLNEESFLELNTWRLRAGMPRFTFVSIPGERRFYLDFLCPLSVQEFFATYADRRRGKQSDRGIAFTEMMPDPANLWQATDSGNGHVAELVEGFRWL